MPPGARPPASAARAIYIGLFASTIIVSSGAAVVSASLRRTSTELGIGDWIALLAGLGVLGLVFQLRGQLPDRNGGEPADAWWQTNGGAALTIWALLEFSAVPGVVAMFATGHVVVFGVLTLLAVVGLTLCAPGRLAPG